MSRAHVLAMVAALSGHAAILLFGGLLLFRHEEQAVVREDVELIEEAAQDEAKKQDKKETAEKPEEAEPEPAEEAMAEQRDQMPDLARLADLESSLAGPALAPLSLAELESVLGPAADGAGGFGIGSELTSGGRIGATGGEAAVEMDPILSIADLDHKPRPLFQAAPVYPMDLRKKKVEGKVLMVFQVDTEGRVLNPKVESSTNSAFDKPALDAVRQWRFEAGTRNGEKVPFKMRVPIAFNVG